MTVPDGPTSTGRNEFTGGTAENVVQVRDVHGDLVLPERTLSVPRQLPGAVPRFTNRDSHLAQLDALLALDTEWPPVVLITGPGGVGKTALSIHWAHRIRNHFPDGQLYINLYGYHSRSPVAMEQILDGFLRALGMEATRIPTNLDAMIGMYRTRLDNRRLLVVLDNASSAEHVRPLLPPSRRSLAIVTSRNTLGGLVVQNGAIRLKLSPLEPVDAVALFDNTLGGCIQIDHQTKTTLVEQTGHLPLTVLITAEQVASRPAIDIAELVDEINTESRRLSAFATADRDTEVRNVFSWSYRELTLDVARVFRLMGLHAGPEFSAPATAALCGISVANARQALTTLTNVSMLEATEHGRYRFHDLIRDYAIERVNAEESEEERKSAIYRELSWYLYTADSVDRVLSPRRRHVPLSPLRYDIHPLAFDRYQEALNWCEIERLNLLAAVDQAVAIGADDIAWKLPVALIMFFVFRRYRTDRLSTSLIAVDAARRLQDQYGEAWALICTGGAYDALGRPEDALSHFQQAQLICQHIGDRQGEGLALHNIGHSLLQLNRIDESINYTSQSLPIWREVDDRRSEAITLTQLGKASFILGEQDEALSYYERALSAAHELDAETEAISLHGIADIQQKRGNLSTAIEYYERALAVRREMGDHRRAAVTLHHLGIAFRVANRITDAQRAFTEAFSILKDLDEPEAEEVRAELDNLA